MASNPFLAMSEDFASAQPTEALNPFLTGDFGTVDTLGDNPFAANNPFSDFGAASYDTTTVTTSIDFFNISEPAITSATNFFTTALQDTYEHSNTEPFFSTAPSNISNVNTTSFFDTTIDEQTIIPTTCTAQKPTELGLTMTHTIGSIDDQSHIYSSDEELKPKRPPPPGRPIAPETKDLIMSVTGHMDFTSSHLLDRIPPTRTPSPVSMRDLHSPSPTPEPVFGDFLGEDIKKEAQMSSNNDVNLFDVDDVVTQVSCSPHQNSSPSADVDLMVTQPSPQPIASSNSVSRETSPKEESHAEPQIVKPPRPGPPARPTPPPPVRPARPTPPSKPPPPSVLPQRPPPIVPMSTASHQPHVPPVTSSSNDFSLFDAPAPAAPKAPTTKEGILSLYSTPKKQEEPKPIDFLTDDMPESTTSHPETSLPNAQTRQSPEKPVVEKVIEKLTPEQHVSENNEFDKPQPMDITPNSEENPIEQTEKEIMINEAVHDFQPNDVTETISDTYTQPTIPTSEPLFPAEPVIPDAHGIESTYDEHQMIPNAYSAAPESNPFAAQDTFAPQDSSVSANLFGSAPITTNQSSNIFGLDSAPPVSQNNAGFASIFGGEPQIIEPQAEDAFDAFSAKFESTGNTNSGFDAFGGGGGGAGDDAWGSSATGFATGGLDANGFGADDNFDAFLSLNEPPPVPSGTPALFGKGDSQESDEGNFNVFIKPREGDVPFDASGYGGTVPILAPPPAAKSPATSFTDSSPRVNPFDKGAAFAEAAFSEHSQQDAQVERQRSGSQEDPPTPLFDEDTSQPLEDFPRIHYEGPGWEVQLRQPNKKKITGQRFWKKIFIRMVFQGDNPVVQLFNSATDKEPFQELPLQACYSVSDIAAQQYDQYGKIFTVKLQYVFYKERPGVRPGQVTKAERITNKLSQFAAYAIQGDYQGVKEFGSDLKKLGLPVEHAPQVSQLFKIGSTNYEDMKQFSMVIEEALFRLSAHRDRALHYKMEEVQVTAVDEIYVEQDSEGHVMKQIARVRLFFLGFLSGMPDVELGVNNMWRQGKEVVGRHDIIPVATEEWIRLEGVEFHSCIQQDEYQNTRIIRFKPPDACYIELMRFRVRPPKNRELPLQLKAVMCVTGNKVELRADVLVPGFTSRSLGQVPCEDVMIRFPIPECWIYLFRVEKHFRYGSVKSAHRRTGKIKGIERFLGAVDTLQESLIEVTSGQAKYEHQHRSIVWRMSRLPKEGQGAYTTHNLVCRMALTSYDQIPEKLAEWCYVEFTMPATQVSHTVVRSVSLQNHDSDDPPEKYVRYLARHEYKVGIEHTQGEGPNAYLAATIAKPTIKEEPKEETTHTPAAPSSDSDSD